MHLDAAGYKEGAQVLHEEVYLKNVSFINSIFTGMLTALVALRKNNNHTVTKPVQAIESLQ